MTTKALTYYSPNISDRTRRDEYQPPHKRLRPSDVLVRAATAELLREPTSTPDVFGNVANVIARHYAGCPATTAYIERAAVSPANSTTATWAAELVGSAVQDFIATDMAPSGFAQLAARALTVPLEQGVATVKIPSRTSPVTLMGSWVGEGSAKPVHSGSFTSTTLQAYKLAALSVFTEEMLTSSAIEAITREVLSHDLSALLDSAIFDAAASSAVRPAGLFNGATSVTASAATPADEAMLADLKALGAAVAGTASPDASIAYVVNPAQEVRIRIKAPAYDKLIVSGYMTAGSVGAIDVGGVAMIVGQPAFQVTSNAALHMDTSATALAAAGATNISAPVRSLFQEDLVGLRAVLRAGWIKRRTTASALVTAVTW